MGTKARQAVSTLKTWGPKVTGCNPRRLKSSTSAVEKPPSEPIKSQISDISCLVLGATDCRYSWMGRPPSPSYAKRHKELDFRLISLEKSAAREMGSARGINCPLPL